MSQQPMTSGDEDIETFREEFLRWEDFLNGIWGILAFTLALGCLGTHIPWVNACICGGFLVILRLGASNRFPPSMIRLRQKAKSDPELREVLKRRDHQFLGVRALISRYPVFLVGWLFLVFVMVSPLLVKALPWLNDYFGYAVP